MSPLPSTPEVPAPSMAAWTRQTPGNIPVNTPPNFPGMKSASHTPGVSTPAGTDVDDSRAGYAAMIDLFQQQSRRLDNLTLRISAQENALAENKQALTHAMTTINSKMDIIASSFLDLFTGMGSNFSQVRTDMLTIHKSIMESTTAAHALEHEITRLRVSTKTDTKAIAEYCNRLSQGLGNKLRKLYIIHMIIITNIYVFRDIKRRCILPPTLNKKFWRKSKKGTTGSVAEV